MPGGDITRRASAEQVQRSTGQVPDELQDLPELPECAEHVWGWFQQLSGRRTAGMSVNPITWGDIWAWSQMTGIKPQQWELDALMVIDGAFLASIHEENKPKPAAKRPGRK